MALNLEVKKAVISQVNEVAKTSIAVGVAQYSGMSVLEMTDLRQCAHQAQVLLRVVKNTLAKRAFEDTDCQCVNDTLAGPVILGFSQENPGAVARVFREFAKTNDKLVVIGLGVTGKFVAANQLNKIADLPTKDQAIGLMMALMLAPVEKLARALNEVPTKVTRVVSAISTQKQ